LFVDLAARKETLEHQEIMAPLDLQVKLVNPVSQDLKEQVVLMDYRESQEIVVLKEQVVSMVLMDKRERKEKKVSAFEA